MKKFLTLALTCFTLYSAAQSRTPVFGFKTALSFNPTVLAATDNTAMIGAEQRLKNRLALVLDAGYVFSTYYMTNDALKGTSGFTFRPGLKLYEKGMHGFFQFQVSYKQVDYKMEDWLGKDCVDNVATYEKFQEFIYRKKTLSFNALAGELFRLSDAVMLELYAGIGMKIKNQRPAEERACYRNTENGIIFSPFRDHYNTINAPVGIKLMVAIK